MTPQHYISCNNEINLHTARQCVIVQHVSKHTLLSLLLLFSRTSFPSPQLIFKFHTHLILSQAPLFS